jgi:hypoxanthine phosphoribosyltransferase
VTTASSPAWPGDIGPTFLSEKQIQQRVAQLGAQISRDYAGKDLIAIGILKGVFPFMADLLRTLTIPITVDFLAVSRYGPSEQTRGVVNLFSLRA